MHVSDTPASPRTAPFWRAFLTSLALIAMILVFNTTIDPLGEIGLVQPHRFNRLTPAAIIRTIREEQDVVAYRHVVRTSPADTFLIGTSRVARGFDLCGRPDILRMAGSGWTIREIAAAQALALETRTTPATLLIEVGAVNDLGNSPGRDEFAGLQAALAPKTTLMSAQTLKANLLRNDSFEARMAACRPLTYGPTDWRLARLTFEALPKFDDGPDSRRKGGALFARMMADANRVCAHSGLRHRIIFFALPSAFPASLTRSFRAQMHEALHRAKLIVSGNAVKEACESSFLDLSSFPPGSAAERMAWRDRRQWTDYNHFSPWLGNIVLNRLLGASTG